jgi:hypothetical protein
MNIFILDKNIKKCALYHCDKHVGKMLLEAAQLLSTVVRLSGLDAGYKITHRNHPCTLWTNKSLSNWIWLRKLAKALNNEYRFRFDKTINHKSYDLIMLLPVPNIIDHGLTPFVQIMPEIYKDNDPVIAYRNYYVWEKGYLLNWGKKRVEPFWVERIMKSTGPLPKEM